MRLGALWLCACYALVPSAWGAWSLARSLPPAVPGAPAVALSSDGGFMVLATTNSSLSVTDTITGATRTLASPNGPTVLCVAISVDGGRIAAGASDGTLQYWQTASGDLIRSLGGHSSAVWSVSISGHLLFAGVH